VLAGALALVGFAVATSTAVPDARRSPVALASAPAAPPASAAPTPARSVASAPAVAVVPVRLPRRVGCHGVDEPACRDIAQAGASVLPADGAAIAAVDVWDSLLCGDELDCPRSRLDGADPLGSVIVAFAGGGPSAWINVVGRSTGTDAAGPRSLAWIVRWQP
jgi:hypothetical protein